MSLIYCILLSFQKRKLEKYTLSKDSSHPFLPWLLHESSIHTKYKVKSLSRVRLFATPWTVVPQAPPFMEFSRQGYWSGVPFPSPGDVPDPGIEPASRCRGAQLAMIRQMSGQVSRGSAGEYKADEQELSRGSAGEYQADEREGVAGLSWRLLGR